jgi:hypothetical protein
MAEDKELSKVPYEDINNVQLDLLPQELQEGKIHQDFVIVHPTGKYPVCGHATRNDVTRDAGHQYCLRPAGWGTDHQGRGFCKLHGGVGAPKTARGRYSKYLRTDKMINRHEKFMYDPEILSLNEEIAILRSLLVELLESKDDIMLQCNELDNQTLTDKDILKKREDTQRRYRGMFNKIQSLVSRITAVVDIKNRIENGEKHTIRIEMLYMVIVQIQDVIKKHVNNPKILKDIGEDLKQLQIPQKQ